MNTCTFGENYLPLVEKEVYV